MAQRLHRGLHGGTSHRGVADVDVLCRTSDLQEDRGMAHLTTTGVSREPLEALAHEEYWRESYAAEPYAKPGVDYDYYATGYRTGWEGRARHAGKRFEDVEDELRRAYDESRTGE